MSIVATSARFVLISLAGAWAVSALADPPAHAPAHGWRKKHDPYYVGYSGRNWENDYDIRSGSCNRTAIATVLGGVVGGVIASRVAEPDNRAVATIIGAAAGALIGHKIGHELDEADRGCFGHVLEIGTAGRPVAWTNESSGVHYEMTPGADRDRDGAVCREFSLTASADGEKSSRHGVACEKQAGEWEVVQ